MSLRVAHLSDPHFSALTFSPLQFFSKRWLGNLNLALFRRQNLSYPHLMELPEKIDKLRVEATILTGDLTSTSSAEEYEKALAFTSRFTSPLYTLPGNHDVYTKRAEREKTFYHYFPCKALEKTQVSQDVLGKGWHLVRIDCARARSLLFSNGVFSPEMDHILEATLASIPHGENVIVASHFPLFPSGRKSHDTERADQLQKILSSHPQVKLYLHGHDHDPYIIDHQNEGHPLVLNAGSSAHFPGGSFYILTLEKESCQIDRYLFLQKEGTLQIDLQKHYSFH